MKKTTTTGWMLLAFSMLTGTTFVTSCSTDDNIDLGDLDKTIGIDADNMNIPVGSADDIKLDDVLSLKEGDVIETLKQDSATYKKGDYQFRKDDDLDPADVKVNEVHFETFDPQAFNISVPFSGISNTDPDDTEYQFPPEAPQKINAFDVTGAGNDDVVKLNEADLDGYFELDLGLYALKNEVNLTEIDLYLPKFLEFDLDYIRTHHDFIKDGIDFKLAGEARGHALSQDEKDYNVLTLKEVATNNRKPLILQVKRVNGILPTAPTDASEAEKGYMVFSKADGLKLHGLIKMQLKFKKGKMKDFSSSTTRNVEPEIDMPKGINVTHAEGIFDPDININPSNVAIGDDVPDFLTDDDVKITLNNPTIKLKIESNINAQAVIKPKMIAYFDDAKTDYKFMYIHNPEATDTDWPIIAPNVSGNESKYQTSYIIITRQLLSDADAKAMADKTGYLVERFVMNGRSALTKMTTDPREVTDIAELLSPHIPNSLDFEIEAQVDQEKVAKVDLYDATDPNSKGSNYHINPSYEFVAPLALDPGSTIVYNDTIADWNKDIKDNEVELNEGEIVITGYVHNNTPLELKMKPVPIGLDKKEISDITVESNIVVPSNLNQSTDNSSPIKIVLKRKDGGSFKNLDGLAFKVTATSRNSTPLNKDEQFIKVDGLTLTLNGKLSISL